jgi:DNA topoisomerase VI subunit B
MENLNKKVLPFDAAPRKGKSDAEKKNIADALKKAGDAVAEEEEAAIKKLEQNEAAKAVAEEFADINFRFPNTRKKNSVDRKEMEKQMEKERKMNAAIRENRERGNK